MHYIPLGDTALRVSRLCLGCMTFGEPDRGRHAWTLPEESSRPSWDGLCRPAADPPLGLYHPD